jgi:predicted transposase YdaD
MTTRPHDALFKSAFEAPVDAAALLRELMPPAVRAVVAWETVEGERGSYVDTRLADQHSDLVFSAGLGTNPSAVVYFVLEHQSTRNPTMPLRMLSYQVRVWRRFVKERRTRWLPPVFAVLVSHAPGGWTDARTFEDLFDPDVMAHTGLAALMPRCSMIVEDLMQRSNGDLAARSLGTFQKLALWLLRDARAPARLLASFDFWMPAMLEVVRARSGLDRIRVLIVYMFQVIGPMHLEILRAKLHALGSQIEEVTMTIAEHFHEEGRQEGRREGRIATLRSLLVFKFQTLGAEHEARLQAAPPDMIDRYIQRLLTADSLAAVFAD